MVVVVLLGLGWLCTPLGALVLDSNYIKSSAGAQRAQKVMPCKGGGLGAGKCGLQHRSKERTAVGYEKTT